MRTFERFCSDSWYRNGAFFSCNELEIKRKYIHFFRASSLFPFCFSLDERRAAVGVLINTRGAIDRRRSAAAAGPPVASYV